MHIIYTVHKLQHHHFYYVFWCYTSATAAAADIVSLYLLRVCLFLFRSNFACLFICLFWLAFAFSSVINCLFITATCIFYTKTSADRSQESEGARGERNGSNIGISQTDFMCITRAIFMTMLHILFELKKFYYLPRIWLLIYLFFVGTVLVCM